MTVEARKILAGIGWVALIAYSNRLLGLITTLILAKMVAPEDFGLVAIASITMSLLQLMKDMGLSESIVYQRRDDRLAIDTANTMLVGLNVVLFGIAATSSPFVARLYGLPVIVPIIILISSNLIWDSLRAVPRALMRRHLNFAALVVPEVIPVAVSSAVSVVMALYGFGVWSLVVKTVLHSVLGMILLRHFLEYRPRFRFDTEAAREFLHYGKFIAGTTVLLVVLYNIDKIYVSRWSGIAALGFFELAMRISDMPVKEFSFVIGSVMFPVFCRMEATRGALGRAFLKTLKYTGSLSIPMAIGISVYGPPLVSRIYGHQWQGMLGPLRVLALYALFRSLSSIIYDAFKASGEPRLMQRFVVFRLLCIGILGIPATQQFGLMGMCVLILATYAVVFLWEVRTVGSLLGVGMAAPLASLSLPFALSMMTIPTGYFGLEQFAGPLSVWQILASAAVSGAAYIIGVWWLDQDAVGDLRCLLRPAATVSGSQ